MAEESGLLTMPEAYEALMKRLTGKKVLGVEVDDSPMLRDLVRLAYELSLQDGNYGEVLHRLGLLVLGNLAATWTLNNRGLETGRADFPTTLPLADRLRWVIGRRKPEQDHGWLEFLAPGVFKPEDMRKLSTQLGARVGDCAMYMLVLGILVASVDICDKVVLVGHPPHAWVACRLRGMSEMSHLDLSVRAHGALEADNPDYYTLGYQEAETRITIWPLEECSL